MSSAAKCSLLADPLLVWDRALGALCPWFACVYIYLCTCIMCVAFFRAPGALAAFVPSLSLDVMLIRPVTSAQTQDLATVHGRNHQAHSNHAFHLAVCAVCLVCHCQMERTEHEPRFATVVSLANDL